MSRKDIENVINQIPELTDFGIGIYENGKGLSTSEYELEFKKNQNLLLKSTDSFDKTVNWLCDIKKIKRINNKHTSYELKHLAEKDINYITNGVFIAAAIHCGFNYKLEKGCPNVLFNMSEKSIKMKIHD